MARAHDYKFGDRVIALRPAVYNSHTVAEGDVGTVKERHAGSGGRPVRVAVMWDRCSANVAHLMDGADLQRAPAATRMNRDLASSAIHDAGTALDDLQAHLSALSAHLSPSATADFQHFALGFVDGVRHHLVEAGELLEDIDGGEE